MSLGKPTSPRRGRADSITNVYTAGFSTWKRGHRVGGFGIVTEGAIRTTSADRLPDETTQCLRTTRLVAVYMAVQALPITGRICIHTSCANLIEDLTTRLATLEDQAWSSHKQGHILEALVSLLRRRSGYITLRETNRNKMVTAEHRAHALAKEATDKPRPGLAYIAPRIGTRLPGARLAALSQSDLYRLILLQKRPDIISRRATESILHGTREAVRRRSGQLPTKEEVWLSLRTRSIQSKKMKAFLWKAMHGAAPCGEMWSKIPGHETKAECRHCDETESMEHIMERCKGNGQKWAWKLTAKALRRRGIDNPPTNMYDALGCAIPGYKEVADTEGVERQDEGKNRLYTKLVAATTYLIWTTRCIWQIEKDGEAEHAVSKTEMENRWLKMVNDLLITDIVATDKRKYGLRSIPEELVEKTWVNVVNDNRKLQESLTGHWSSGVLVGID
ncbi:hypothetical protein BKA70DRAFT_1102606 [Coprinopsis sp. MPI-PUGE-AT-0042]|nr:hypothetical protein BKA70DRAFT_1102606 [Coprinopsis sp. MPI-PUGE-AT-0042]